MEFRFFGSLIKFWHETLLGEAGKGELNWTLTLTNWIRVSFHLFFHPLFSFLLTWKKKSLSEVWQSERTNVRRRCCRFDSTANIFYDVSRRMCDWNVHLSRIEMPTKHTHTSDQNVTKSVNISSRFFLVNILEGGRFESYIKGEKKKERNLCEGCDIFLSAQMANERMTSFEHFLQCNIDVTSNRKRQLNKFFAGATCTSNIRRKHKLTNFLSCLKYKCAFIHRVP